MKKEKLNYFDEFGRITNCIEESTKLLVGVMKDYSVKDLIEANKKIHSLEHDSDGIVHIVRRYLVTDFLPPIDREDIGLLLHKLDDIEDCIDEVSKNFQIFDIEKMRKFNLDKYLELLVNASNLLHELFANLSSFKNKDLIIKQTIKISVIEEEADRCFEESIYELYKKEKDAIEVVKWTKIYNGFESLFDAYENAADTIEDIIIKNS